ncbi:MAG TPA: YfiR family protein [Verrucomicrobiae bacterium]|nr:YfiR family protein [Verrucomicrobiae bacterium]
MRFKTYITVWLCAAVLAGIPANAPAQSKEYQIKAAFLFNFAQFVNWPSTAFTETNAPFCIGILGDDPFGQALDQTVQGETVDNRKIIIERSKNIGDLKNCQMIFVSRSEKKHINEILANLDSQPVLTVGEVEGFAESGGDIDFYLAGPKVRFEINPTATQSDGLKVSSQLLSLGKIVQTAKGDK